jgi:hypothetical protein
VNAQLEGIEAIEGTYPFDLKASLRTLRINRFFWHLARTEYRDIFLADEEEAMRREGLSDEEKALVRARDWLGLVRYGTNFFVLEKFARVVKMSNLEVYAKMRGESFEDFMKTRKVPDAR